MYAGQCVFGVEHQSAQAKTNFRIEMLHQDIAWNYVGWDSDTEHCGDESNEDPFESPEQRFGVLSDFQEVLRIPGSHHG